MNQTITARQSSSSNASYGHSIRITPALLSVLQTHEPVAKLSVLHCFESSHHVKRFPTRK